MSDPPKDKDRLLEEILRHSATTEERTRNIERNFSEFQTRYYTEMDLQNKRLETLESKVQRQDVILAAQMILATLLVASMLNYVVGVF